MWWPTSRKPSWRGCARAVSLEIDTFGQHWRGTVDSVSPGSGAVFALLPPDNATGNFTKIVQRFPVRIQLEPSPGDAPAAAGHVGDRHGGYPMNVDEKVSLRAWVAVGGLFGCFMAGMNVHVTSAALPEIEGALGASFEEGSWISTAYLVAEISMIPLTAWLVQVFSLRRVMLVGSWCSWPARSVAPWPQALRQ
jgi:hypothetical protein